MKTLREREDERRKEKLREVRRQVKDGSLVVRRMTPKEHAAAREARNSRREKS
jgi:hypothetical protein